MEEYCLSKGLLSPEITKDYWDRLKNCDYEKTIKWMKTLMDAGLKDKIKRIYKRVKTFQDLLETNILFIEGKFPVTWRSLAPVYDLNTIPSINIHRKFGFFTTDGQLGAINIPVPLHLLCEDESEGKIHSTRAYVEGVIFRENAQKIIESMKQDYVVHCVNPMGEVIYSNLSESKNYFNLTNDEEEGLNFWPKLFHDFMNGYFRKMENENVMMEIRSYCVYLFIASKGYIQGEDITDQILRRVV